MEFMMFLNYEVNNLKKIMVFGNGGLWSLIKQSLDEKKYEIIAFVNSDENLKGDYFEDSLIISVNEIKNYEYDLILLASSNVDLMYQQLSDIPKEKIVSYDITSSKQFDNLILKVNNRIKEISNIDKIESIMNKKSDIFSICTMNRLSRERNVELLDENTDFIRISSLELAANEIYERNIEGNVAELGVYKGNFAKYINKLFPDRKLYLFDTFEGFNDIDVEYDLNQSYSKLTTNFSDTTLEQVIKKMPIQENLEIKKGYFPETAIGLEDTFCFVSLDTDLYLPIYEGLKYFYPRLAKGGYIFIHDYNNNIFNGAKLAVRKYCEENSIPYIPISDRLGTVIIAK